MPLPAPAQPTGRNCMLVRTGPHKGCCAILYGMRGRLARVRFATARHGEGETSHRYPSYHHQGCADGCIIR